MGEILKIDKTLENTTQTRFTVRVELKPWQMTKGRKNLENRSLSEPQNRNKSFADSYNYSKTSKRRPRLLGIAISYTYTKGTRYK